jgi:hypothetical protein
VRASRRGRAAPRGEAPRRNATRRVARGVGGLTSLVLAGTVWVLVGCGERAATGDAARRDGIERWLDAPAAVLPLSLAEADGGGYTVDSAPRAGGSLRVTVRTDGAWPADTLSRPTHDLARCRPVPVAPLQGAPDGVGGALVWLVGVSRGPADRAARRVSLVLERCVLQPLVTRLPRGGTLLVRHADAMETRLRFADLGRPVVAPAGDSTQPRAIAAPTAPRALVPFTEPGAVAPLTELGRAPGLLRVTDDRHPWVAGWLAVAPHPFVALTDDAGRVVFAGVPPGRYVLVAWHARLGARALPALVEAGVEARLVVSLPGAP